MSVKVSWGDGIYPLHRGYIDRADRAAVATASAAAGGCGNFPEDAHPTPKMLTFKS
jgi:hypothetical protein